MKKKWIWIVIVIFLMLIILFISILNSRSFFSYQRPVSSNLLVIEAWVPSFEVEQAIPLVLSDSLSRVVIVGQNFPDDSAVLFSDAREYFQNQYNTDHEQIPGVWLLTHSSLLFNLDDVAGRLEPEDSLTIGIRAVGSKAAGLFAHLNLIVNGKFVAGTFTNSIDSMYSFRTNIKANQLQSVLIHFDNDLVHENSDRNLLVTAMLINDLELSVTSQNTYLVRHSGKYSNGFGSQAQEKKNYLIQSGIPEEKVIALSFEPVRRNQTLAAALSCRNDELFRDIRVFNVLSSGFHSRRTWVTYSRVMGRNHEVGIITFISSDFKKGTPEDNIMQWKLLMDEAFSYLFNWVTLTFF